MTWTRKDDMNNTVALIRGALDRVTMHNDERQDLRLHVFYFSNLGQDYCVTVEQPGTHPALEQRHCSSSPRRHQRFRGERH